MPKGSLYSLLFQPKPKGLNAKKVPKVRGIGGETVI